MTSYTLGVTACTAARLASRRLMSTVAKVESVQQTKQSIDLVNFNPNNYNVPLRPVTMDDTLEPYGSWKVAYEAERKRANLTLLKGILCLSGAIGIVLGAGVFDGVILPNLDNIMEDTEPFDFEKEEGRISV